MADKTALMGLGRNDWQTPEVIFQGHGGGRGAAAFRRPPEHGCGLH